MWLLRPRTAGCDRDLPVKLFNALWFSLHLKEEYQIFIEYDVVCLVTGTHRHSLHPFRSVGRSNISGTHVIYSWLRTSVVTVSSVVASWCKNCKGKRVLRHKFGNVCKSTLRQLRIDIRHNRFMASWNYLLLFRALQVLLMPQVGSHIHINTYGNFKFTPPVFRWHVIPYYCFYNYYYRKTV